SGAAAADETYKEGCERAVEEALPSQNPGPAQLRLRPSPPQSPVSKAIRPSALSDDSQATSKCMRTLTHRTSSSTSVNLLRASPSSTRRKIATREAARASPQPTRKRGRRSGEGWKRH
ncbi:hypothetical protein THAOC_29076, partial [Thalassiosira oceanica]